jgi:hypothetical protein
MSSKQKLQTDAIHAMRDYVDSMRVPELKEFIMSRAVDKILNMDTHELREGMKAAEADPETTDFGSTLHWSYQFV